MRISDWSADVCSSDLISAYLLGQAIAPGIGLFITSLVLSAAPSGAFDGIPFLSSLAPWRTVFFPCGAIGLVVAALLLLYREPPRRDARSAPGAGSFGEAFRPEEQQSELKSLTRMSSPVLSLNKTKY